MNKKLLITAITLTTITVSAEYILKQKVNKGINFSTSQELTGNESSCLEVLNNGGSSDGFYDIVINSNNYNVYCDQTTDGGGWTLIAHVYDNDNQDDMPNSNMTAGWGNTSNLPDSNSSFNIPNSDTPSYTQARWEWQYPLFNEKFSHRVDSVPDLINDRFYWGNFRTAHEPILYLSGDSTPTPEGALVDGILGSYGYIAYHPYSGSQGLYYYGWASGIEIEGTGGQELSELGSGLNRSGTGINGNVGTRNSIVNMWVR